MIEEIRIKNFQAHSKLLLKLSDEITTIIGPSDVGKSAIIRALWWLISNRPNGEAFVRHNSKGTIVAIKIDGNTITRKRGSGKNEYSINGNPLKSFGLDVPSPISDLLNISADSLQSQHDSPYWFSETPGQISKNLNSIIDLGIIDSALGHSKTRLRKAKLSLEIAQEDQEKSENSLKRLAWVEEAKKEFIQLERKKLALEKFEEKKSSLDEFLEIVINAREKRRKISEKFTDLSKIQRSLNEIIRLEKKRESLKGLLTRITELQRVKQPPTFYDVEGAFFALNQSIERVSALESLLQSLRESTKKANDSQEKLQRSYEQWEEIKDMECPLCGRKNDE